MPDVQFHLERLQTLRANRSNFESQWEEAAQRLIPAHVSTFHQGSIGTALAPGAKNTEKMFDATAALALHRFQAVIESLATPQGQQWHRLVPSEPGLRRDRSVRQFLDEVNRLLFRFRYRPKANYVGQSQAVYQSYGAYGNGALFIDMDTEASIPAQRYKCLHLGETFFMQNHQGTIDTMYREFPMRAREIVQKFDKDGNVPKVVHEALKDANKAATPFMVVHAVYPRGEFDPQRVDSGGMPFASVYILKQTNSVLREGGYRTFPTAVARYTQAANEVYGRGPAQMVLPAIKVLNEEKKTVLKQGHRIVDPVLLAHDDGVIGTFSMRPGAINPGGVDAQGRALVQPLPTGNISVGKELMDDERAVINDAFLITMFQILLEDKSRMTATEVLERAREKGVLVAPTTGRLQAEYLGPKIEREVDLLEQAGVLPPVPPALTEAGGGFEIEYDAPMSRMARAEDASGFMRSLDMALAFFTATQDPGPLDWFNFDEAVPAILDINGAPVEWTNTVDQVREAREQRAQAQREQQLMDQAPAMASAAKTVADMGGG